MAETEPEHDNGEAIAKREKPESRSQPPRTSGLVEAALDPQKIKRQVQQIQGLMEEVMEDGEHYTDPDWASSPILKKAGAEKIAFAFRLSAEFDVEVKHISDDRPDLPDGHREYFSTCRIYSRDGEYLGMTKGSCSTAEPKYRYRSVDQATEIPPPGEFWDSYEDSMANADFSLLEKELRANSVPIPPGADVGVTKDDKTGDWYISIEGRAENQEIEAQYNTCLKMSQKRSYVGTIQQVTAASDIFTQDLDDPDLQRQVKEEKGAPNPTSPGRSQGRSGDSASRGGSGKGGGRSPQRGQPGRQGGPKGGGGGAKTEKRYGVTLNEGNAKHVDTALQSLRSRPDNVSFEAAADTIRDHYDSAPDNLQEAIGYMIADEKPAESPTQGSPEAGGQDDFEGDEVEIGSEVDSAEDDQPVALPDNVPHRELLVEGGIRTTTKIKSMWDEDRLAAEVSGIGTARAEEIVDYLGFLGQSEAEEGTSEDDSGPPEGQPSSEGEDAWDDAEFDEDPPF